MIFDDHKDICIVCSNSIRQSAGLSRNELIWCTKHNGIEPGYYHCEFFQSKFSTYNYFWGDL